MLKKILHTHFFVFFVTFVFVCFCARFYFIHNYNSGLEMIEAEEYSEAVKIFKFLNDYGYKDSSLYLEKASNYVEYKSALDLANNELYQESIEKFNNLGDFEDSHQKLVETKYNYATNLYNKFEYENAYNLFIQCGNYRNSPDRAKECKYKYAEQLYKSEDKVDKEKALQLFTELDDYKGSQTYLAKLLLPSVNTIQETIYIEAEMYFNNGEFNKALENFESLGDYKDSKLKVEQCIEMIQKNLSTTISAGLHYSVALDNMGNILCTNSDYEFENWKNVISVSGFGTMIIGLKEDGSVILEGHKDKMDPTGKDVHQANVEDWNKIVQVSAGQQHVVGLKSDGTVVNAGLSKNGLSEVDNWKGIKSIDAGWLHTVGLSNDGNIYIVGQDAENQLKQIEQNKDKWTDIIAISAGGGHTQESDGYKVRGKGHTVGLRRDGHVVAVGDNDYGQCNVDDWTEIIAISAGDWHTVGLKRDGTVISTRPDPSVEPKLYVAACEVDNDDWEDIVAISAGCGTTMGIKKNGDLLIVGFNDFDQRDNAKNWSDIKIYKEWDFFLHNTDNQ